jgi:dynein assembly factor 1
MGSFSPCTHAAGALHACMPSAMHTCTSMAAYLLPPCECRYVQQNCIHTISGLEKLENLDTINLSQNQLRHLEGLSCCPNLRTLICTNNQLASVASVQHLTECKGLHTLDLQDNQISDPAVLDVLKQLPELRCLYLKGNPVVSSIKNYRKTLIAALPELKYLDERPVFEDERRLVTAWWVQHRLSQHAGPFQQA